MNGKNSLIYLARIDGLPIMDLGGDQVGKVRDVVVQYRASGRAPLVKGLVAELFARRRIFIPMLRVYSIAENQIVISGVVNTRQFKIREREVLIFNDLFDKSVARRGSELAYKIFDVAILQTRQHDWEVRQVALREIVRGRLFGRGRVEVVDWSEIPDLSLEGERSTQLAVAKLLDMLPADVARELHDMEPQQRAEIIQSMDDGQLAEALEELPEQEQVAVIAGLDTERAADVLEEMDPDDAADLIAELEPEMAQIILERMEPADAEDVRILLAYDAATAGGLMTPEPIILPPDATVADALASMRQEEISPAMACLAFICRQPLETPTGKYLGAVHIQRLLREPPSELAARMIDTTIRPLRPDADIALVSRYFATYDLVCAPVVDEQQRLVGAVTVDDVLDHILPPDWRGIQLGGNQMSGSDHA